MTRKYAKLVMKLVYFGVFWVSMANALAPVCRMIGRGGLVLRSLFVLVVGEAGGVCEAFKEAGEC